MAAATLRLSSPALGADGTTYWLEGRPAQAGRTALVRRTPAGVVEDALPAGFDVRSRVHEYGAGAYAVGDDGTIGFAHAGDQALYVARPGTPPVRLTTGGPEWRFGDLVMDPTRGRLLAVAERRRPDAPTPPPEPQNLVVAVDLGTGALEVLLSGHDFYASPTPSPDGGRLAFLAWDHPHMPWDASALYLADLDEHGNPGPPRHVAGDAEASAQQPAFARDGTLYFIHEPGGYWNLFRAGSDGAPPVAITAEAAELGIPLWQLGTRTWGLLDARTALVGEVRAGVSALVRIDLGTGARSPLALEVASVSQLAARGDRAALLVGWPDQPAGIALVSFAGPADPPVVTVLRESLTLSLPPADVSRAEPMSFPTSDGDVAHGFFYPPTSAHYAPAPGEKPPLMLLCHGGPTAAATPALSPAVQFWTTRGLAVFDLNYRGSTGHGRRYRDRLRGSWGVYDVADCLAAARALVAAGKVDPQRLAIRGGSAGGFTVLATLVAANTFHAGTSLYGVSDLGALARDTHKFESHYCDGLVGPWPARADLYRARSPLTHADRLACPVIFFQGLDDEVVPPAQTARLVEALRAKQVPVEYHAFPGEEHGFRQAETIRTVYETELAFYGRVFGFTPGRGR
jgi:dipeptidyl aminopeptidase/acylaminoacyl peptidase